MQSDLLARLACQVRANRVPTPYAGGGTHAAPYRGRATLPCHPVDNLGEHLPSSRTESCFRKARGSQLDERCAPPDVSSARVRSLDRRASESRECAGERHRVNEMSTGNRGRSDRP